MMPDMRERYDTLPEATRRPSWIVRKWNAFLCKLGLHDIRGSHEDAGIPEGYVVCKYCLRGWRWEE